VAGSAPGETWAGPSHGKLACQRALGLCLARAASVSWQPEKAKPTHFEVCLTVKVAQLKYFSASIGMELIAIVERPGFRRRHQVDVLLVQDSVRKLLLESFLIQNFLPCAPQRVSASAVDILRTP
jgi:hypothetical protein